MNLLEAIDSWVLLKCTRLSHFLQRNTGLTNFFVAKIGLFMCFLSVLVNIGGYWFPLLDEKPSLIFIPIQLFLLVWLILILRSCTINEDRLFGGKLLFHDPVNNWLYRIQFLFLVGIYTVPAVHYYKGNFLNVISVSFFMWGMCMALYFMAVTPLPPGMNRLRKAIEKFRGSFQKPVPVSS